MRVLLDSSVLIAAVVQRHPHHNRARPWLKRAQAGEIKLICAAHSLAEVYSGLTGIPFNPRISPDTAMRIMTDTVLKFAKVVALGHADYAAVIERAARHRIVGGAIYDVLIARVAEIAKVDQLVTLNAKDFSRVWPDGAEKIVVP